MQRCDNDNFETDFEIEYHLTFIDRKQYCVHDDRITMSGTKDSSVHKHDHSFVVFEI